MLKPDAALRKDRTTSAQLQHRHFAEIARIISAMTDARGQRRGVATYFADHLACTNPRFDRARFLRACGIEE